MYFDQPLGLYTHTKTGGPADVVAFPTSKEQVQALVQIANDNQVPVTVIGNASNLIIRDGGIRGLVIILTKMTDVKVSQNEITACAGAAIIEVTKVAQGASLTGLEFAAGIPGSVGGAIFMNAGAYGGEIKEVATGADVLTAQGEFKHLDAEELDFGYRHSSVQDNDDIVLSATFTLQPGDPVAIQAQMDDLNARRAAKQPLELPSCGSVFKRPTGYFAGKLIHDAGLQGFQIGGAQVSTKHAGFIVNVGGATATNYMDVIRHVQETVLDKFGVVLETEVRILGENPRI
ncbi:UDP-N-acetylenolpyruvoylglucosamine reductase [Lentilactobacillus senioris DSM 24302 = JCM 17472]|uniref:UDP-N-acetylenolpyruvoylglucosamine reductase n=2 Tax=Lentilactobacillus senioris TaxID=931534 RepID=A0A0R2CQ96_9LACO|nr:UDP-N-acetylenolpyruvoylglucosamine reductase [Lentilactobacillus senioris DSM 24302 = JCM 17472]